MSSPNPVYLDNNATTKIHPDVVEAMSSWWNSEVGNPASQHSFGRRARRVVEDAREFLAVSLGANINSHAPDRLVFCGSGSEANNLAISGVLQNRTGQLLVSPIEHPSVAETVNYWRRQGRKVQNFAVDLQGVSCVGSVREHLDCNSTALICAMLGNHETGVLQPVSQIAQIATENDIPVHCDAVQVVGKQQIHFGKLLTTTLSFAAHKFHGPCGIAALLIRSGSPISPILHGGFQQYGLRPGTESVALVVGMRRAFEISMAKYQQRANQIESLRSQIEGKLTANLAPVHIHGESAFRLPHVTNVSFPGVNRQALVMALDFLGIAVSTGSACQSGSSEPSSVLLAMGVDRSLIDSSIRISLSYQTTSDEVDRACDSIIQAVRDLRSRAK